MLLSIKNFVTIKHERKIKKQTKKQIKKKRKKENEKRNEIKIVKIINNPKIYCIIKQNKIRKN